MSSKSGKSAKSSMIDLMICSVSSWDKVNFWAIIPPMSGSSSLSQLPRRSLVDCAIDAMREKIESGAWPVGERIPKETELAEMLQVGRNTVREAIRVLSHADVLEVRQGDGTYVRFELDRSGGCWAIRRCRPPRGMLI